MKIVPTWDVFASLEVAWTPTEPMDIGSAFCSKVSEILKNGNPVEVSGCLKCQEICDEVSYILSKYW